MKKTAFFLLLLFSLLVSYEALANPDAEYEKAVHYYNQGKFKEAAKLLKEYVRHKPDAVAYYRAGYSLYKIKKFDEADEYFRQAYLLDPNFTPQIAGPVTGSHVPAHPLKARKSKSALSHAEPPGTTPETPSELKQEGSPAEPDHKQQPAEVRPVPPVGEHPGSVTPRRDQPLSEPPKADPPKRSPMNQLPPFPQSRNMPPAIAPGMLAGLLAGFATVILIVEIAVYVYFCLCMFLIAKKLDVPNPWLAWIPIVQVWTVVSCAGKPWWWILLLIVPFVNIIVAIAIWMAISENLGRNKWLGLLMMLPIVNFVYMGVLAFSKEEKTLSLPGDATPA